MIESKKYNISKLGTFDEECLLHRFAKDWWYATGYFEDETGHKYSYQFTILSINVGVNPFLAMVALTDLESGRHYYRQKVSMDPNSLAVTKDFVAYGDSAIALKCSDGMRIKTRHKDFEIDVKLDYNKGAFWHCDNGKLYMGKEDNEKETTYYYSYTNLPTKGTLVLNGKKHEIKGKSWFDKQGGSYSFGKVSSWEWFSLRFYDDEEMMLFKFPTTDYVDGTFISKDSQRERLNNYTLKTNKYIEYAGSKWSAGWDLYVPGKKEENYTITPLVDGAINLAYFEEICVIKNSKGEEVGMCFAELLPHLYDDNKQDTTQLFKNYEV